MKTQKTKTEKVRTKNKKLLDDLVEVNAKIKELTYIELGIFLRILGLNTDWVSLGEAHDYLGGYKNEDRDGIIKNLISEEKTLEVDVMILTYMGLDKNVEKVEGVN